MYFLNLSQGHLPVVLRGCHGRKQQPPTSCNPLNIRRWSWSKEKLIETLVQTRRKNHVSLFRKVFSIHTPAFKGEHFVSWWYILFKPSLVASTAHPPIAFGGLAWSSFPHPHSWDAYKNHYFLCIPDWVDTCFSNITCVMLMKCHQIHYVPSWFQRSVRIIMKMCSLTNYRKNHHIHFQMWTYWIYNVK